MARMVRIALGLVFLTAAVALASYSGYRVVKALSAIRQYEAAKHRTVNL